MKLLVPTLAACALAAAPAAAEVVRYKNAMPNAPILQGALVKTGTDIFHVSGMTAPPLNPDKPADQRTQADYGDMKAQTVAALTRIKAALEAHGYTLSDCVKMLVLTAAGPAGGRADFAAMNEGFRMFFGTAENPNTVARSAIQVAQLGNPYALVEIEVIAAK